MSDLIWLNGQIIPLAEARVSVEDRGFQFADGVYEVVRVYNGRPFTLDEHLDRLDRSCGGISLEMSMSRAELSREMGKLIEKAGLKEGMIYLQVTRGCAPRNHVFTKCQPTVLFYTRVLPAMVKPNQTKGLRLVSVPDERWSRCWVKSIGLVANVLAKNTAIAAGADEAVFVQGGMVTECSTSNIFIVSRGSLLTHPVGPKVLPGITRLVLLEVAKELGIPTVERPISEGEVLAAEEVF
ncbi:MAG TPA: aminotransferase class IV, partial [Tepidisphaeraceae bacterium]|nr:aminotransferase class IV [Tepidisphaeraceae bacterium]